MIYMFYIMCGAIKNRSKITPYLADRTIKKAMTHPISFWEIIRFKDYKIANLGFWLIGALPPALSVFALTLLGKQKHLL